MTVYEHVRGERFLLMGREEALCHLCAVVGLQPVRSYEQVDRWIWGEVVDAFYSDDEWIVHRGVDPKGARELERRVYGGSD